MEKTKVAEQSEYDIEGVVSSLLDSKFKGNTKALYNYLKGLKFSRDVNYWDYLNVDALLSLQQPISHMPDELIFITYHQICELYFKIIIHEIAKLQQSYVDSEEVIETKWADGLNRVKMYFDLLTQSIRVLHPDNFSTKEFLSFRLLFESASGYQTAQLRKIEFMLASPTLLTVDQSGDYSDLYWKNLTDHNTKEKLPVLAVFEAKYDKELSQTFREQQHQNLNHLLNGSRPPVELKEAALSINSSIIKWKKAHKVIALKHLESVGYGSATEEEYDDYLERSIDLIHYFRFES